MTTSSLINKALAFVAATTFLGALEPISAGAWDEEDTLTVQLDLGNGGGGGPTEPCVGDSTLTLGLNTIVLDKNTAETIPKIFTWTRDTIDDDGDAMTDEANDDGDPNSPDPRNLQLDQVEPTAENKRTVYSGEPFSVSFDASSCDDSVQTARLDLERGPVLREESDPRGNGPEWIPAEMTFSSGVLSSSDLRGDANLLFDDPTDQFDDLPTIGGFSFPAWEAPPAQASEVFEWGVVPANTQPFYFLSTRSGNAGVVYPQPKLTIFGDSPTGKWKVSFSFLLEVQ